MVDLPLHLAQVSDDGPGWSSLYYLLIFVVVPLVNWIKDKFVERATGKTEPTAETEPAPRPVTTPEELAAPTELPIAKLLEVGTELGFRVKPPQVPGATAPPPPPIARPVQPVPPDQPTAPRPAPRPTPTPAMPDRQFTATLTGIGGIDLSVNLRDVIPKVDVRSADPRIDLHAADPTDVIHQVEVVPQEEPTDLPGASSLRGPVLMGRKLTQAEMRRAVAVREVLDLPIGLRGPGGMVGPDRR